MKMGDFHEELAGKFIGWQTLKVGHYSGCDVMKQDETEFMEWKNRDNTMNSSSASSVIKKLSKLYEQDKKVFLVLVNVSKKTIPRFGAPEYITILNGQQAYEYLSGRKTFYKDLLKTITNTFTLCSTYKELLKHKEMHL
jgi:anion-transporting  ArsA/GET3 family ATPase